MMQTRANGRGGDATGMPSSLEQIGSTRKWELLMVIPLVAEGNGGAAIELFHLLDDLGDHSAQAISNGNDPCAIIFGRLDMQHVVDPSVRHPSLENIQGVQFTGFFHTQATLNNHLLKGPIPICMPRSRWSPDVVS